MPNIFIKGAAHSGLGLGNEFVSNSELYATKLRQNQRIPANALRSYIGQDCNGFIRYPISPEALYAKGRDK